MCVRASERERETGWLYVCVRGPEREKKKKRTSVSVGRLNIEINHSMITRVCVCSVPLFCYAQRYVCSACLLCCAQRYFAVSDDMFLCASVRDRTKGLLICVCVRLRERENL